MNLESLFADAYLPGCTLGNARSDSSDESLLNGLPMPDEDGEIYQTLRRIADHRDVESKMQRLRLKADGRIVELRDGQEFPLAPAIAGTSVKPSTGPAEAVPSPPVRDLRQRARLTQLEFAARLGVPVETIRNWEQGKRLPRGPARALLAVIAHAPETVFAALART
jgi:putative transcriptional regulator